MTRTMNRLAVYCGSASPQDPRFIQLAYDVGKGLAQRGIDKGASILAEEKRGGELNGHELAVIVQPVTPIGVFVVVTKTMRDAPKIL